MKPTEFASLQIGDLVQLTDPSLIYHGHFKQFDPLEVLGVYTKGNDIEVFVKSPMCRKCTRMSRILSTEERPPGACGPWLSHDRFQKVDSKITEDELKSADCYDPNDLGKLLWL